METSQLARMKRRAVVGLKGRRVVCPDIQDRCDVIQPELVASRLGRLDRGGRPRA